MVVEGAASASELLIDLGEPHRVAPFGVSAHGCGQEKDGFREGEGSEERPMASEGGAGGGCAP